MKRQRAEGIGHGDLMRVNLKRDPYALCSVLYANSVRYGYILPMARSNLALAILKSLRAL